MSEPVSIRVTTPTGVDSRAPIVSGIRVTQITTDGATISWCTDEPAITRIEYGPRGGPMRVFLDRSLVVDHTVVLSGLSPGKEYVYRISATDAHGNTRTCANRSFATPRPGLPGGFPPVLEGIGAKRVYEGETLEFVVRAFDRDTDSLTYGAEGLPPGASFDPETGRFSWTPAAGQTGTYRITFSVCDGAFTDEEEVAIFVLDK